jgi:ABC-type transport system substrate-binding protein
MDNLLNRQLSRRDMLRGSLLLGGSAAFLAACGGGSSTTKTPKSTSSASLGAVPTGVSSTGAPGDKVPAGVKLASKQTATFAVSNMESSIDPMVTVGGGGRRFDIYETLLDQNPVTGEVRPFLATAWKQINTSTYQFTLRPGVKFHDGTGLTADDVIFSLERGANTTYATSTNFSTFASATAISASVVQVKTNVPDVLFLKKIAAIAILPKAYYTGLGSTDKVRAAAFAKKPIGTGPYKFVSYTTEKAVVEKADTTWRHPTLEQVTILLTTDTGTQLNSFLSGDVDYVNLMPVTSLSSLTGAGATIIELVKGNDLGAFMDSVDKNGKPKTGPMGNQQVRQALNYALNKDELVTSVLKGKTVSDDGQLIAKGLPGYSTKVADYPYDLAKAKSMLDAAGYPVGSDGKRFSISMASAFAGPGSTRLLIGEYMQNAITALDVDVKYQALTDVTQEIGYFYDTQQRPDIYHFGLFTRPFMDAARAYNYFTTSSKTFHMSNARFDTLFDQQQSEFDTTKREAILESMATVLHDEATYLFATNDVWIDAANSKLRGVVQCDVETEQYFDLLYMVD